MSEISEAFIVVGFVITILIIGFVGIFLIGKKIYLKHKKYDMFSEGVQVDAVSVFLAYLNVKVEIKKFRILREIPDKAARQNAFFHCHRIQNKIPSFDDLKKSQTPLLIENFLSQDEIKFLTIEQ